ncbi:MAG: hypothetical protein HY657_08590 [Acidobacteria bacterium]|nr:hypothetical protein [Acidobacteriota bacterium]
MVDLGTLGIASYANAVNANGQVVGYAYTAGNAARHAVLWNLVSDTTPPVITPTVTGTPGTNGWYTSDVQVSWSVTDPDSAISASSGCGSSTVSADTAGTTFTCTATSAGGPASESVTVARDATPPTITGSPSPDANANGWNNTDVTVSFVCSDNVSGVATCASDITLSVDGASQSVSGNAVTDLAGNTASTTVSNINIDKTAPAITASRTPANDADWNNTDVTVTFTCSDPVSGLAGPCPPPETLTAEGAGQSRSSGPVLDLAGNSAASVTVSGINIDKTAPTITGSRTPAANAAGWNNTDVTVTFACTDPGGSGVGTCGPSPQTVTSEGTGQSRTGTVADLAGNTASTSVGDIHIDKTAPVIVIITPTLDSLIASSPVTVQVQAADAMGVSALSVNGVPALLAGGTPQSGTWQATVPVTLPVPVGGALSFTASAGDLAGNLTVVTTVVDNDGIDAAIDTQPQANSNDFSDVSTGGTTSGTITSRGGWTVNVKDVNPGGGVEAVVTGTGTTATLSTCAAGGAERVELDGAGETASVECVPTTDVNTGSQVTAINATSPAGNPKVLVRNAAGKVQARLSTGQSVTIGSPVTAGSTNIGSVLVELLDDEGVVFASFSLAAAQSVDVTFTTWLNDVPVVELHVLVGPVDFTIGTRTVTLDTGEAGTFPIDVTPPTIGSAAVTPAVLWPANHKMVDVAVSYQATDDRDPAPTCSLSAASNEPLNGTGDGDTSPDWVVVDARRLQLRAERSGTGTGRVYTLTVTCGDASGNLATRPLAVTVPKNQR